MCRAEALECGRTGGGHSTTGSSLSYAARALVAGVLGLTAACGGASSRGASSMDGGVASTGGKCGPTAKLLVDYMAISSDLDAGVAVPEVEVNDTHLYFNLNLIYGTATTTMLRDAYIMRVPLRGGEAERVAHIPNGMDGTVQSFALTKDAVISGQAAPLGTENGLGAVLRIPLAGGEPTMLAPAKLGMGALVVDDKNVYFVDAEGTESVSLAGGAVRTLSQPGTPISLALIGDTLYMADIKDGLQDGTISSVPTAGGDVTVLAQGLSNPWPMTACGTDLCWFEGVSQSSFAARLVRMAADGGTPKMLAQGFLEPHAIVFDGKYFFITDGSIGIDILRVPAAGGEPVRVTSNAAFDLALDDECLYWSNAAGIWSMSLAAARVKGPNDD